MDALCIVVAMKPMEGTFAANAVEYGVAGLNVDGCRIETADGKPHYYHYPNGAGGWGFHGGVGGRSADGSRTEVADTASPKGRWPANVVLDGSEEVAGQFPDVGMSRGGSRGKYKMWVGLGEVDEPQGFGDSGSASRFFKSLGKTS